MKNKYVTKIRSRIVSDREFGETRLPSELYDKFMLDERTHLHWEYNEKSDTITLKPI